MSIDQFTKIAKIRSYETVIEQFVHLITTRQIKPGDKLPTERVLSDKLDISRPILREAFRVMESFGFIESRIGSGRYLRTADYSLFGLPKEQEHLALYLSFMEARTYIEVGTVTLACVRAQEDDMERISDACKVNLNAKNFVHWDTEFHFSITIASHNPVLEWIMGSQLFSIYFTGAWDYGKPERWQEIENEHNEIYNAIQERNPQLAKKALLYHLGKVRENIINNADSIPK